MLRAEDAARVEAMRRRLGRDTKVSVVREALDLLEARVERDAKVEQWRRAAKRVAAESARVNRELRGMHPLDRAAPDTAPDAATSDAD